MPPCLATTSLQVVLKPAAMRAATRCARFEASMLRRRALKAILPIGGRLLRRSSQSLARILRRSQAHIFSTGLRSGEDGGTRHARTPAVVMARLLAAVCKKASLSQSAVHGPAGLYICLFIYVRGLQSRFFSRKCLSVSITRIKVSSYLATPSCGGRGVPRSPFYVAWLAEELIHRNKIILL